MRPLTVSPDGTTVATIERGTAPGTSRLRVVSLATGTTRDLLEADLGTLVSWLPDSRTVLVFGTLPGTPPNATRSVLAVSVAGGAPKKWNLGMPVAMPPVVVVHPDGRQVAFMTGEQRNEIWALENFLPAAVKK